MPTLALAALLLSAALLCPPPGARAAPPEPVLDAWGGTKTVLLRTEAADPVADPQVQNLLAAFLDHGFRVHLGTPGAPTTKGLIADLRGGQGGPVLTLSTAEGEVLAIGPPPWVGTVPTAADASVPSASPPTVPPAAAPAGPVALSDPARGVAVVARDEGGLRLALLGDTGVRLATLSAQGLEYGEQYPAPSRPARALYLSSGDTDGDGRAEVAAVWAEDVQGVYTGTDSRLHAVLLRADGDGWEELGGDRERHLRIVGGRAVMQDRGPYRPFDGPVRAVGGPNAPDVGRWAGSDLLSYTPLGPLRGLGWEASGRLQLLVAADGTPIPGGLLLDDLGPRRPPALAVRLEEPEYRTGFEKEDRVGERWVPLPPKVLGAGPDTAYTLRRGRHPGLPLVGRPTGQDQVVRIRTDGTRVRLEEPFPPVTAYVTDFDVAGAAGSTAVLLLAGDADGDGPHHLLVQMAR